MTGCAIRNTAVGARRWANLGATGRRPSYRVPPRGFVAPFRPWHPVPFGRGKAQPEAPGGRPRLPNPLPRPILRRRLMTHDEPELRVPHASQSIALLIGQRDGTRQPSDDMATYLG